MIDIEDRIGNPAFAIETNLDPLVKRISDGRTEEALKIVEEIRASLEKIKVAKVAIAASLEKIKVAESSPYYSTRQARPHHPL